MSALNQTEIKKLSCMYDGDKSRDASSKIRGFLFQDYVAIDRLLQPGVEYVCSEYLEDVDAFYENGTFEFIQVKYYPKKTADMKEISTDLYYQYLRLQMLNSDLNAQPRLYIHTEKMPPKPDADKMREYMGFAVENKTKKGKPKKEDDKAAEAPKPKLPADVPDRADPAGWLSSQVHVLKKDAQKKTLFDEMASLKTLDAFLNELKIEPQKSITEYKEELLENLARVFPDSDPDGDAEHWQMILLGLAVSYIQRRYLLVDPGFDELRVDKEEFFRYMRESSQTRTEDSIANYLVACVSEEFDEILKHNELSELQIDMLNRICKKTIQWIGTIGRTPEGQHQLLNTFRTGNVPTLAAFCKEGIRNRLNKMEECRDDFVDALDYLWKIMLDMVQEQVRSHEELDLHEELFDPKRYIVPTVTEYVCLYFPEDKISKHSVILPPVAGKPERAKRKIADRMVKMPQKPEKWFFKTDTFMKGIHPYSYSTANINDNLTVADLGGENFYIECMKCIQIDNGGWNNQEHCGGCIFSRKCVEGGTKL